MISWRVQNVNDVGSYSADRALRLPHSSPLLKATPPPPPTLLPTLRRRYLSYPSAPASPHHHESSPMCKLIGRHTTACKRGFIFFFFFSLSLRGFLFSSSRVLPSNCRLARHGPVLSSPSLAVDWLHSSHPAEKLGLYSLLLYVPAMHNTKGVKAGCDHLLTSTMPLRDTIQATPILTHRMMRRGPRDSYCPLSRPSVSPNRADRWDRDLDIKPFVSILLP